MKQPVFIVFGESGSGKTTCLQNLKVLLEAENLTVGGIVALGIWKNNKRDYFDLIDLKSGDKIRYCQRAHEDNWDSVGPFFINPLGQSFGELALSVKYLEHCNVVFIDEIGPFELAGKGWAKSFEEILKHLEKPLVVSVRESLLEEIIQKWDLKVVSKISATENPGFNFVQAIKEKIETK